MAPYLKRFLSLVYPEFTELALASFNEKAVLTDAADLIEELQARVHDLSQLVTHSYEKDNSRET